VHAPDDVIEDACQFAWSRLVRHRTRVQRETVLSWLTATAVHEALKLVRRAGRELSLEAMIEQAGELSPPSLNRAPHSMAEDRERLGSLTSLPQGQQRLLWLFGLGLSYEEIARRQGCTGRVVERQLHQARASLRLREAQIVTDLGR
jgi:RNA polymerase sigma factor (sigma-70 family)